MTEKVMRFVITNMDSKRELRILTLPAQGRHTFATRYAAEEHLKKMEPSLREKVLGDRADTLEVTEVECWPKHFDPKQTVW